MPRLVARLRARMQDVNYPGLSPFDSITPQYGVNPQLESRTPVTVLTGFLGSGKTTLLNRILAGASGIRFGVLVNDFGELNIDARLVSAVDGNAIDLSNGCVCCTMQGGLVTGVRKMLSRARPPEHIIVEASGIADPLGIVSAFHTPALAECAALDAVVGVVDVEHVRSPRLDRQVVEDQIRAADLIVLNKTDLVLERARCETRDWLRSIVPDVRVLEAQQADIPLEALFGGELRKVGEKPHSRTYDAHLLQSWSYESDRPLAYRCVRTALEEMPDGIFRAKGFLYLADAPNLRFVVHRVGRRLGIDVHGPWADERRASAIVLLGEPDAVTVERIVALFDDCTTDAFPLLQPENFKRLTGRAYDRAV